MFFLTQKLGWLEVPVPLLSSCSILLSSPVLSSLEPGVSLCHRRCSPTCMSKQPSGPTLWGAETAGAQHFIQLRRVFGEGWPCALSWSCEEPPYTGCVEQKDSSQNPADLCFLCNVTASVTWGEGENGVPAWPASGRSEGRLRFGVWCLCTYLRKREAAWNCVSVLKDRMALWKIDAKQ